MPLIAMILGLGQKDTRTSLLRDSKGVVASPVLLDELLLHWAVKVRIFLGLSSSTFPVSRDSLQMTFLSFAWYSYLHAHNDPLTSL